MHTTKHTDKILVIDLGLASMQPPERSIKWIVAPQSIQVVNLTQQCASRAIPRRCIINRYSIFAFLFRVQNTNSSPWIVKMRCSSLQWKGSYLFYCRVNLGYLWFAICPPATNSLLPVRVNGGKTKKTSRFKVLSQVEHSLRISMVKNSSQINWNTDTSSRCAYEYPTEHFWKLTDFIFSG